MILSQEFEFFIYLLHHYADHKKRQAPDVLRSWNEKILENGQTMKDFIYQQYFMYHQESLENAYLDIDHLYKTGKPLEF